MNKEPTKTLKYLFPALKLSWDDKFRHFMNRVHTQKGIINAFLYDTNRNIPEYSILIVLDPKRFNRYEVAEKTLREHESYVDDYEIEGHPVFVLKLSAKFYSTYDNFLLSKYSKMYSDETIQLFGVQFSDSKVVKVLRKDKTLGETLVKDLGLKGLSALADEYDSIIDDGEFITRTSINPQTSSNS